MATKTSNIENADIVENIFGSWPSFHDAEVHNIVLTRDSAYSPQLDVTIHHWAMTSEVDSKGYYVLKKHTLTTLRFAEIADLQLAGFNHQNVLWDLEISEILEPDSKFAVSMPTSYGCEASFKCKRITVLSAVPC
jgi:immunity protein 50 of polymorphic toxin system